jgi:hypothetical protein
MRSSKTKDMIRSILPSKNREAARKAKAGTSREHRRTMRDALGHEDPETTKHDFGRSADQSMNVWRRRAGDKLNHFMRWCDAITDGMTQDEALAFVRGILPSSLIGDHAYGHWKTYVRYRRGRRKRMRYPEIERRRMQSFHDSLTFRLRRALMIEPDLHTRLNAEIKTRKQEGEPRRLLQGVHDIPSFVATISWRTYAADPFAIERDVTFALVREIEQKKGGRKAALRLSGRDRGHARARVWLGRCRLCRSSRNVAGQKEGKRS